METESPNYKKILDLSFRLLSRMDYSRSKLLKKLNEKGFEIEEIEPVIERLIELNYLNEENYTKAKVKGYLYKGYSNQWIQRKLASEEIEVKPEIYEQVLESMQKDEDSIIDELIQKKLRKLGDPPSDFKEKSKYFAKIARFLASKGHRVDFDKIKNLANQSQ